MRVLTVVGARPQFIKAAPVRRALEAAGHTEILVHTGQHYDEALSAEQFRDLDLAAPQFNLEIGSARHGAQTAGMLVRLEELIAEQAPDWVLVYGDTNSTLAGALAAVKLHVPLAHVEAGQRSYNRCMPEEINRVLTDHASNLLLCATTSAMSNLAAEGIHANVHVVGDVMIDALAWVLQRTQSPGARERLGLAAHGYVLVTVHRAENTDHAARLAGIVSALDEIGEPVVFPVHPRTSKALAGLGWTPAPHVHLIEPVGYRKMIELQRDARLILTDSGGMQKEACYLGVPCVILRDETEWTEIVEAGWAVLAGADRERITSAAREGRPRAPRTDLHGDGHAAERVVTQLEQARTLLTGRAR
jgi:UDP-N-acetylglucosamine 2-epimerase